MPDTAGECIRQIRFGEDGSLAVAWAVVAGSRMERLGRGGGGQAGRVRGVGRWMVGRSALEPDVAE